VSKDAASRAFRRALGRPDTVVEGPAAALVGVEQEYQVLAEGRPVDFRDLLHSLPVPGRRLDPGDLNAYRLESGLALTCDEAEAEVASPPVPCLPGFSAKVAAWAACGRSQLEALLPAGTAVAGYSTHLSVSLDEALREPLLDLFLARFAPALMLLLGSPTGYGLYLRPRPGRLEACGDHVGSHALQAAAALFAGGVRACAAAGGAQDSLPPALAVTTAPATGRWGLYLGRRRALGFDLYAAGLDGRLSLANGGVIGAAEHLALCRQSATEHLDTREPGLAVLDAILAGDLPLPAAAESPLDLPAAPCRRSPRPGAPRDNPAAALSLSRCAGYVGLRRLSPGRMAGRLLLPAAPIPRDVPRPPPVGQAGPDGGGVPCDGAGGPPPSGAATGPGAGTLGRVGAASRPLARRTRPCHREVRSSDAGGARREGRSRGEGGRAGAARQAAVGAARKASGSACLAPPTGRGDAAPGATPSGPRTAPAGAGSAHIPTAAPAATTSPGHRRGDWRGCRRPCGHRGRGRRRPRGPSRRASSHGHVSSGGQRHGGASRHDSARAAWPGWRGDASRHGQDWHGDAPAWPDGHALARRRTRWRRDHAAGSEQRHARRDRDRRPHRDAAADRNADAHAALAHRHLWAARHRLRLHPDPKAADRDRHAHAHDRAAN
jgi:hypothetical protein